MLETIQVFSLLIKSGLRRFQPLPIGGFLRALQLQLLVHLQKKDACTQRDPGE